jgi:hypothetical protein
VLAATTIVRRWPQEVWNDTTTTDVVDWAKQQFWAWHLYEPIAKYTKQPKYYDGLDHMLLLGWICKALSGMEDMPFVLHFWDLSPRNLILDEEDDLLG